MKKTVCDKYILKKRIGGGSFGQIYRCADQTTGEVFAAKIEKNSAKIPQLSLEANLYKMLNGFSHVCRFENFSKEKNSKVLIIELLGKSLEAYVSTYGHLSMKTVLMLVDVMISSIEYIHKKHFIHRDIKPDNFMTGKGSNSNKLYLIDFGLSKRYEDVYHKTHIINKEGKKLTGTIRYASVNAQIGNEQSRRDDMESLGYVLIYLLLGRLPWMGISAHSYDEKHKKILEIKQNIKIEELCLGLPNEFHQYFADIKNLGFSEEPDYSKYRRMFRKLFMQKDYIFDEIYEWTIINLPQQQIEGAQLEQQFKLFQLQQIDRRSRLRSSRKHDHSNKKRFSGIPPDFTPISQISSSLSVFDAVNKDHNKNSIKNIDDIININSNTNIINSNNSNDMKSKQSGIAVVQVNEERDDENEQISLNEIRNLTKRPRRFTRDYFSSKSDLDELDQVPNSTAANAQLSNIDDFSSTFEFDNQLEAMNLLIEDLTKKKKKKKKKKSESESSSSSSTNSSSSSSSSSEPTTESTSESTTMSSESKSRLKMGKSKSKQKMSKSSKSSQNSTESTETNGSKVLDSILSSIQDQQTLLDSLIDV